jgi:hypothetical protein
MKITYAIKQGTKFVKTKSKSITEPAETEAGVLHTTIDKAYEVLCKHEEYDAIVITLRKEVK